MGTGRGTENASDVVANLAANRVGRSSTRAKLGERVKVI